MYKIMRKNPEYSVRLQSQIYKVYSHRCAGKKFFEIFKSKIEEKNNFRRKKLRYSLMLINHNLLTCFF